MWLISSGKVWRYLQTEKQKTSKKNVRYQDIKTQTSDITRSFQKHGKRFLSVRFDR